MIKVYISSPYTNGDKYQNVRRAMMVAKGLIDLGLNPLQPLLNHFFAIHYPLNYETFMQMDLDWVEACDCVLRMPGESEGADREVVHAINLGIPVFHSIEELKTHYNL